MRSENIIYRDFDLSMTRNEITDDVSPLINLQSVKRSIRHLFMLNKYDIPFNSQSYAGLKQMLFEPVNKLTIGNLSTLVEWLITNFEPRVVIKNINISADQQESGYDISLTYTIKSLNIDDTMDITLKRVR